MSKKNQQAAIEFNPFAGGDGDGIEDIIGTEDEVLDFGNEVVDTESEETDAQETAETQTDSEEDSTEEQSTESETAQEDDEVITPSQEEAAQGQQEDTHDSTIPKSRLERETAKRRELEEMNRRLQQKVAEIERSRHAQQDGERVSVEFSDEIKNQAQKIFQAIGDENLEDASEMFNNILKTVAEQAVAKATADIDTKVAQGAEDFTNRQTVAGTITQLKQEYPELDQDSDNYNQDAVDETLLFQKYFIEKGQDPATALRKAASKVMGTAEAAPASTTLPPKQASPKQVAEANNSQPPRTRGQTNSSKSDVNKVDITKLSDEEFEQLAEKELKKLRGDFIS